VGVGSRLQSAHFGVGAQLAHGAHHRCREGLAPHTVRGIVAQGSGVLGSGFRV